MKIYELERVDGNRYRDEHGVMWKICKSGTVLSAVQYPYHSIEDEYTAFSILDMDFVAVPKTVMPKPAPIIAKCYTCGTAMRPTDNSFGAVTSIEWLVCTECGSTVEIICDRNTGDKAKVIWKRKGE